MSDSSQQLIETQRFQTADLLFSRTDKRGVIQSANEPFYHVSGFDMSEIVGAPHKIIRHPSMPKAIFRLLWSQLERGEKTGGYVLNKTKDGQCYWVFAVLIPIEAGYVSLRIKPKSSRLAFVKKLYERLLKDEATESYDMDIAVEKATTEIRAEGFDNYLGFISECLHEEIAARCKELNITTPLELNALREIETAVVEITENAKRVSQIFERSKQIPYNMRLQAGRLEGSDGPISVVSGNHRVISQDLTEQIKKFREKADFGIDPLRLARFNTGTASLINELFKAQAELDGEETESRVEDDTALQWLRDHYTEQTKTLVADMARKARNVAALSKDFRRSLSGLEMTRIMCEIERSKISGDTAGLDEITDQLQKSEKDLSNVMIHVDKAVAHLLNTATDLQEDSRIAA